MADKINTYSTPVAKLDEGFGKRKGSKFFERLMGEDGAITVTLNKESVRKQLADEVYSDQMSFMRELLSNAYRSCRTAVSSGMIKEGLVSVVINHDAGTITIEDNGTGITHEKFEHVLSIIGTSDNHDANEGAQFGMGVFSYLQAGRTAEIDTAFISDGGLDGYVVRIDDATTFTPVGTTKRTSPGTTITINMYRDPGLSFKFDPAKHDHWDMKTLDRTSTRGAAMTCARLSNVKTRFVEILDGMEQEQHVAQTSFDEAAALHLKDMDPVRVSGDGFEMLIGLGKKREFYLHGMPIKAHIPNVPEYFAYVINIHDERKYRPMPNREEMRPEAVDAIWSEIVGLVRRAYVGMDGMDYKSIRDYQTTRLAMLYRLFSEFRTEGDRPILEPLGIEVSVRGKGRVTKPLYLALYNNPSVVYTTQRYPLLEQLEDEVGSTIIMPDSRKPAAVAEWKKNISKFGIPALRDVAKKKGIRLTVRRGGKSKCTVHTSSGGKYKSMTYSAGETHGRVIRVDSGMMRIIEALKQVGISEYFSRNADGIPGSIHIDDWLDRIGETYYDTNKGRMLGRDIALSDTMLIWTLGKPGAYLRRHPAVIISMEASGLAIYRLLRRVGNNPAGGIRIGGLYEGRLRSAWGENYWHN